MSKYGVISGPYFPVLGLKTGKYGPEKTPYLDTFHAVYVLGIVSKFLFHFKTSLSVIKPVNFYSSKHLVATSMYFHQIMQPLTRGFRLLTILEKKIHLTSSAAFWISLCLILFSRSYYLNKYSRIFIVLPILDRIQFPSKKSSDKKSPQKFMFHIKKLG